MTTHTIWNDSFKILKYTQLETHYNLETEFWEGIYIIAITFFPVGTRLCKHFNTMQVQQQILYWLNIHCYTVHFIRVIIYEVLNWIYRIYLVKRNSITLTLKIDVAFNQVNMVSHMHATKVQNSWCMIAKLNIA